MKNYPKPGKYGIYQKGLAEQVTFKSKFIAGLVYPLEINFETWICSISVHSDKFKLSTNTALIEVNEKTFSTREAAVKSARLDLFDVINQVGKRNNLTEAEYKDIQEFLDIVSKDNKVNKVKIPENSGQLSMFGV